LRFVLKQNTLQSGAAIGIVNCSGMSTYFLFWVKILFDGIFGTKLACLLAPMTWCLVKMRHTRQQV